MNENTSTQEGNKTFTQDDVNRIVQDRLSKEKVKQDAAIAQREQEIAQRELLLNAREKIQEKGLPVEFLEVLNISSPEALEKGLELLDNHITNNKQAPALPQGTRIFKSEPPPAPAVDEGTAIRQAMGLK